MSGIAWPTKSKFLSLYKINGKKPLPLKSQQGEDVVIIFSDTQVSVRGKYFNLIDLFRNDKLGVFVDVSDTVSPTAIVFQYMLHKGKPDWK
ncbi:MAG: hypothetical protein HQK65_17580 [Desulfamplus sp.]|nr:hypothetical protein [Desulfamplus sp.]